MPFGFQRDNGALRGGWWAEWVNGVGVCTVQITTRTTINSLVKQCIITTTTTTKAIASVSYRNRKQYFVVNNFLLLFICYAYRWGSSR